MKALRGFEDWVAAALEDRLGGVLGARLQPVDLARRLGQAMDDRRVPAAGRTFVPNAYRFHLAATAYAEVASFAQALEDQLAEFARGRAAEHGYDFPGRPSVRLLVDPELAGDRVRLDADIVDAGASALGQTRVLESVRASPNPVRTRLGLAFDGRDPMILAGDSVALGRALDNAVIVDHASVSRHHARLVRRGAYWLLEDLGSTHGCYVNGQQVTSSLLRAGDEVRLGSAVLRVVATELPPTAK